MRRNALQVLLVLVLVAVAVGGGLTGCKPGETVPDADAGGATPVEDTPTSSGAATPSAEVTPTELPTDGPAVMRVKLYFGNEDRVMAVEREIPYTTGVAKAALLELLKGPSATEMQGLALHTQIPAGTTLDAVSITNGVAKVDLSGEFDDGGGTLSVTMRLAQVVYTLCQFPTIDSVEFYMDGTRVDVFTGEGLILEGPQTPEDYYSLVPVDA
ncbi:MAG: GerMN domain-containing protein [Coriobacteriia bacterium]